nr:hypothetical protein L203_06303 [Cryptococcus depauperatus CBS 7841]
MLFFFLSFTILLSLSRGQSIVVPSTSTLLLNASQPQLSLTVPAMDAPVHMVFSICQLSKNTSITPTALVAVGDRPSFLPTAKLTRDGYSGGVSVTAGGLGYNKRAIKDSSTWLLQWSYGFANWTANSTESDIFILLGLNVDSQGNSVTLDIPSGNVVVQLAISQDPIYSLSAAYPTLGDTTSSSALIFSPLLYSSPQTQPSYPNYTLPGAQLVIPSASSLMSESLNSSLTTDLSLILIPTNSSPTSLGLDNSVCAINAALNQSSISGVNNTIYQSSEPEWMAIEGREGFRKTWVLEGLQSGTNYTAWLKDGRGVLSRPAWLVTKQEGFACQLVMPSSICPGIGYAAPLPANYTTTATTAGQTYNVSLIRSLPDNLATVITNNLDAFSTSLLSKACGRDLYSHVSSCLDCYNAYRDWLCRMVIPQCGVSDSPSANITSTVTGSSISTIFPSPSTIHRTSSNPRNPSLPAPSYDYDELLPCMSTCNKADRTCPVWLGVRCPKRKVNAAKSYAFVGDDHSFGDGSEDQGVIAADRWGRRWCNG